MGGGRALQWISGDPGASLRHRGLDRRRAADLVLALQHGPDPGQLRDLLSRTLGDPDLVVGLWSENAGHYLDAAGRPVALPDRDGRCAVTLVERAGAEPRPLAAIVHDRSLAEQEWLMCATIAAARLALDNARLHAAAPARAQVVRAALYERRALERDLHDGLQPRLLRLSWLAEQTGATVGGHPARSLLDQLAREARETYATLRDLAHGLHPRLLDEGGLALAVTEHAVHLPVPILVDLPAQRWPAEVEAAAYFVILEAMTDRCSKDVYISQAYNNNFPPAAGIFLKRNGESYTPWSDWMPVNGHTHIRWWCHSTTGNWADPGTWRIDGASILLDCFSQPDVCRITGGGVSFYTFDVNGWTAERSRCDSNATRWISARLGPNRLLQMRCIRP